MPFPRYWVCCSFFEKGWPLGIPNIQGGNEAFLVGLTEVLHNHFQFHTCLKLRAPRQITGDDLLLMEVTHLDRYIAEDLSDPWSSIENNCFESVSLSLQCNPSLAIYLGWFAVHFVCIEVLLQVGCPYDTQTGVSAEERYIRDNNNRLRSGVTMNYRSMSDPIPYPILASTKLSAIRWMVCRRYAYSFETTFSSRSFREWFWNCLWQAMHR